MAFNFNQDSPDQIKAEGRTIVVNTSRADGNYVINWSIPQPRDGASAITRAYNGVIVTASLSPSTLTEQPVNGVKYVSDETLDFSLHAGDKIGNSFVIGTFYNNINTNTLTINGIPQVPVYITVHAVSSELKYHADGVHAYEQTLAHESKDLFKATRGSQLLSIPGAALSDAVSFIGATPSTLSFLVDVDGSSHTLQVPTFGINNYRDLIDAINFQLIRIKQPFISEYPVNTGAYWVDVANQVVYQWDGSKNTAVNSYFSATNPHSLSIGYKWFDLNSNTLKEWNGTTWITLSAIISNKSPNNIATFDLWFDGTDAYFWNGTVWIKVTTYHQENDPSAAPVIDGQYWYDSTNNVLYFISDSKLQIVTAILSDYDPTTPLLNSVWLDIDGAKVYTWNGTSWDQKTLFVGNDCATTPTGFDFYYDISNEVLTDLATSTEVTNYIVSATDPTDQPEGNLWWDTSSDELFIRANNSWVEVPFNISPVNPIQQPSIKKNSVWIKPSNDEVRVWEGNTWKLTTAIFNPTNPYIFVDGVTLWFDTSSNTLYQKVVGGWNVISCDVNANDPSVPVLNEAWFNTTSNTLNIWNGLTYIPISYNTTGYTPNDGAQWYNPTTATLYQWSGSAWITGQPIAFVEWSKGILLTSTTYGSNSHACYIVDGGIEQLDGTLGDIVDGVDEVSSTPMMYQPGIGGTDGSNEERLMIADNIRRRLGHPTMIVELTNDQINDAIDRALRVLRTQTSVAYHRKVGFMEMKPRTNSYIMSNKKYGYDKIVDFMKIYRLNSSFMSVIGNDQIYGQLILQQLYQAGSFDLVSYHLISQQIELLQKMFAGHVQFNWYERTRELTVYNLFSKREIVLIDVIIERSENELFVDRVLQNWIERYALAECREMLADIRGKFATLPGASGGISLNASDLMQRATEEKERCMQEINDFVIEQPENFDGVAFIMG